VTPEIAGVRGRQTSCIVCEVLALPVVLGALPLLAHFWLCSFSARCPAHNFVWALAFPGVIRGLAILVVFGPPTAFTLAVHECYRDGD